MALMNSHDMPLQAAPRLGAVRLRPAPRFWGTGAAFIAVYFALNLLTEWHEFDRLGITLWSPDDGLSLALLIEKPRLCAVCFLARFWSICRSLGFIAASA